MKLTVPIEGNRPNPTIFVKKFIWKKLDPISIFPLPKDQSVKYHQRPTIFITEITDWFYLKKREIQFSFYFSTSKGSEHQSPTIFITKVTNLFRLEKKSSNLISTFSTSKRSASNARQSRKSVVLSKPSKLNPSVEKPASVPRWRPRWRSRTRVAPPEKSSLKN